MNPSDPNPTLDPWQLQRHAIWHNRVQQWRQAPGETAFHALAWLALGIMLIALLPLAARSSVIDLLRGTMLAQPLPWMLGATALLALHAASRLTAWERQQRIHWCFAQPVAERVRRHERWRVLGLALLPHALAGILLLCVLRLPAVAHGLLMLALLLAGVFAALWAHRSRRTPQHAHPHAALPRWQDTGRGRLWRWQKIEAGAGFSPRVLARGGWILLLIPIGASAIAAGVSTVAGLCIAAGISAWRRSLDVLLQAQNWLWTQPLRLRFWLGGALFPTTLALLAALVLGSALAGLGATRVAHWIGLGLLALALLQIACVLAERRRPHRVALLGTLHLLLLGATAQVAMPLLPLVWLGLCLWLLRRAARP